MGAEVVATVPKEGEILDLIQQVLLLLLLHPLLMLLLLMMMGAAYMHYAQLQRL